MTYQVKLFFPDSLKDQISGLSQLAADIGPVLVDSGFMKCAKGNVTVSLLANEQVEKTAQLIEVNSALSLDFAHVDASVPVDLRRSLMLCCLRLKIRDVKGLNHLVVRFSVNESAEQEHVTAPARQGGAPGKDEDTEVMQSFVATVPKYRMDKVILDHATRVQIDRAITMVRNRNLIFEQWGFKEIDPNTKTILCFYGAPGTGKTMCAHALASELGKKIIIASYAAIESKWVGEGPKNMRKIFQDAEEQDAILFFDEADSFLSKRVESADTGSDKHYNRMSNEMFQLLEDYNGIIIFATNMVADFDKAFKSRILAFVEFSLPDKAARKQLIQIMIPSGMPLRQALTDEQLDRLSELIDGFSGREIRKSMLTVLSDGALRGVPAFSYDDFEKGFMAVKKETEDIERSMNSESSMSNVLQDFMKYGEENAAIMEICLNMFWLNSEHTDEAQKEITQYARV